MSFFLHVRWGEAARSHRAPPGVTPRLVAAGSVFESVSSLLYEKRVRLLTPIRRRPARRPNPRFAGTPQNPGAARRARAVIIIGTRDGPICHHVDRPSADPSAIISTAQAPRRLRDHLEAACAKSLGGQQSWGNGDPPGLERGFLSGQHQHSVALGQQCFLTFAVVAYKAVAFLDLFAN